MIAELIAIGLGIALHQTKPLIEGLRTDSQTVKNLAHYGAGYIGAGLVFKLFIHDLAPHDQRIAKSGFWLAARPWPMSLGPSAHTPSWKKLPCRRLRFRQRFRL